MRTRWAILTGEYPPQPGGVSDYTRLVARGLAEAGDEVPVWAAALPQAGKTLLSDGEVNDRGVTVHRLPDHFGSAGLSAMTRELGRLRPSRILVQYVPHAFGLKAMNIPFCMWVFSQRRDEVWTMFHEVAFPWVGAPMKHNVLAAVNRLMALLMARSSKHLFVSTPAWGKILSPLVQPRKRIKCLPVPSNLPTEVDRSEVAALRESLGASDRPVVGYFGSFSGPIRPCLYVLPMLLAADTRRIGLLLGRGGDRFAREFADGLPDLRSRTIAPGELAAQSVAVHLAVSDVLVLPFPDGVTCRRSSVMAGLALGIPIVTTTGPTSEPLWRDSGALVLVPADDPRAILDAVEGLLFDEVRRQALSIRARAFYRKHFSVEHTLDVLLSAGRQPIAGDREVFA